MADMTMDEIMALGETHTKAMAPKKKKKKKKMMGVKQSNPVGLAASSIEGKQGKTATAFNDFMSGGTRVKR